MIRRILYFQTIVTRNDDELVKKIFDAQMADPVKGDWVNMLKEDFQYLGEEINENEAKTTARYEFKKNIKSKVRKRVLRTSTK